MTGAALTPRQPGVKSAEPAEPEQEVGRAAAPDHTHGLRASGQEPERPWVVAGHLGGWAVAQELCDPGGLRISVDVRDERVVVAVDARERHELDRRHA